MLLKQKSGFTLVEILVVMGLLGIITIGVIKLSSNMQDIQTLSLSANDEASFTNEIRSILKNPNHCRLSLASEDPATTPITFEKKNIDEPSKGEGLPVELWLGNQDGTLRVTKKMSSVAPTNKYGKIKILDLKLVMDNGVGSNYSLSPSHRDEGHIIVNIEKKINATTTRTKILTFPVSVSLKTNTAGLTTILGCSSQDSSSFSLRQFLVIHSQTTVTPTCPTGWDTEWSGFSYVLSSLTDGMTAAEDLGDVGSCLQKFGATPHIEVNHNHSDYITPEDYSMWLWSGTGSLPSRCSVCSKTNTQVITRHSQTAVVPNCPSGFKKMWAGYSLILLTLHVGYSAPQKLSGTGSCIQDPQNGIPFIECSNSSSCIHVSPDDYASYLTTKVGQPDESPSSPVDTNKFSRCVVCEFDTP